MNRLRLFTMATLMALTFTACDEATEPVQPPPPPPAVGTISGTVTIEGTGATGVTVTLSSGATSATGAGGNFSFTGVGAGSYTATISGYPADASFPSTTQVATIASDGQVVQLTFAGQYIRASSVVGTVVAEDAMMGMGMDANGDGMPDALDGVTVSLGGMFAMGETASTVAGGFAFTGLRAGTYTVSITNTPADVSFGPVEMGGMMMGTGTSIEVTVGVGEVGAAVFAGYYLRTSSISGSVSASGDGIAGVEVTLTGQHAGGEHMATDAEGNYAFDHLRAGTYTVAISNIPADVSFASTTQNVTVGVGQAGRVSFSQGSYVRNSSITGVVATSSRMGRSAYSGSDGIGVGGIDGVRVQLSGEHAAAGQSVFTENGGRFTFSGLRAGDYTVTISGVPNDARFESLTADVSVGNGQTAVVDAFENGTELFEEGTIAGHLYIDGNENKVFERTVDGALPLAGATITLESLGSGATSMDQTTTTDDTGGYSFGGLDAGTYRVWVDSDEQVYKDGNVQVNGPGTQRIDLVEGTDTRPADFPFVISSFDISVSVVYGHDEDGGENESPAEGADVSLFKNSDGTGQVGKKAKTGEDGIATIALTRANVGTLAAKTIVFSQVTKRPDKTASAEDPLITFTLDKNTFDNSPGDDHNLLWTEIKVRAGYIEEDGMAVPDSRSTGTGSIDFTAEFQYPSVKVSDTERRPDDSEQTVARKKNGMVEIKIEINADTTEDNAVRYGKYVAFDATSQAWQDNGSDRTFTFTSADDDVVGTLAVEGPPRVSTAGEKKVKAERDDTVDGEEDYQTVEGTVDGSSNVVYLGDFTVSYPWPEIKARIWHETNEVPGFTKAARRGESSDNPAETLGMPDNLFPGDTTIVFSLEYSGADLEDDATTVPDGFDADDFADGSNSSCTVGTTGAAAGVISCVAPANADEWRIVATALVAAGDTMVYDAKDDDKKLLNPGLILLADGAGDVELELDDLDVQASAVLEPSSAKYVVDLGNGPFSYKFVDNSIKWIAYNRSGTRAQTTERVAANRASTMLGDDTSGDITIPGIEVVAVPDEGMLGLELLNPMSLSARATGNTEAPGVEVGGDSDNDADFTSLLEGKYTISVSGTTSALPRDEEDMRGVVRVSRWPVSVVPLAEVATAVTVRRSYNTDRKRIERSATVLQDVEYQGSIEGYVFNNLDDNNIINTTDERLINVMVVAELDNCITTPASRRVVFGADTTLTDEKGKYEFKGWEISNGGRKLPGCYTIAPVGLETMPEKRAGFQPGAFDGTNLPIYDFPGDVISLNLNDTTENEAAGNRFELPLGSTTTDADFEAIYDGGTVSVRVSDATSGSGVEILVTMVRCDAPAETVGGPATAPQNNTVLGKVLTTVPEACSGTLGGRQTQTTDASGNTEWPGLDEGYYRFSTDDSNVDGTQAYQQAGEVVRIHQPTENPVRVTVNLGLNRTGG